MCVCVGMWRGGIHTYVKEREGARRHNGSCEWRMLPQLASLPEACSCPVNTDMEAISTASQKEGKINKVATTTETVQKLYGV